MSKLVVNVFQLMGYFIEYLLQMNCNKKNLILFLTVDVCVIEPNDFFLIFSTGTLNTFDK